jgi:hypothetical protein
MHGPKIPEDSKKAEGFCVYRFFEEARTENSVSINAINRGFPGKPDLRDVMNISRKISDSWQLFKYSGSFSPEQKAQHYYLLLRSDPGDRKAEARLIELLPEIAWSTLLNEDSDDLFNIMNWFKDQSVGGNDKAMLSLLKSRSGIDGAPAEGYFDNLAEILDKNPSGFVKNLASLNQNDIDEIIRHISYVLKERKEIPSKLDSLLQGNLSGSEKKIVQRLLGSR